MSLLLGRLSGSTSSLADSYASYATAAWDTIKRDFDNCEKERADALTGDLSALSLKRTIQGRNVVVDSGEKTSGDPQTAELIAPQRLVDDYSSWYARYEEIKKLLEETRRQEKVIGEALPHFQGMAEEGARWTEEQFSSLSHQYTDLGDRVRADVEKSKEYYNTLVSMKTKLEMAITTLAEEVEKRLPVAFHTLQAHIERGGTPPSTWESFGRAVGGSRLLVNALGPYKVLPPGELKIPKEEELPPPSAAAEGVPEEARKSDDSDEAERKEASLLSSPTPRDKVPDPVPPPIHPSKRETVSAPPPPFDTKKEPATGTFTYKERAEADSETRKGMQDLRTTFASSRDKTHTASEKMEAVLKQATEQYEALQMLSTKAATLTDRDTDTAEVAGEIKKGVAAARRTLKDLEQKIATHQKTLDETTRAVHSKALEVIESLSSLRYPSKEMVDALALQNVALSTTVRTLQERSIALLGPEVIATDANTLIKLEGMKKERATHEAMSAREIAFLVAAQIAKLEATIAAAQAKKEEIAQHSMMTKTAAAKA